MLPRPSGRWGRAARPRWYQIPLSSARVPRSGLFSYAFQAGLRSYQHLRARKNLRVGSPVPPPPPGLLWVPDAPQLPHGSQRARGAASTAPVPPAPRHPKEPCSTRRGQHRGPRAWPRPSAHRGSATSCQHRPVPPGGDTVTETAPRHTEDTEAARGSPSDSEEELIPLQELLLAGRGPQSPPEHCEVPCPQPAPLANSLDALLLEKREQRAADALRASLARVCVRDDSPQESGDEDTPLLKEQRALLSQFAVTPRAIPATHPGECVFHARPLPPPALDTQGLRARSVLELNFLSASPARQAAFVRDGRLSLLYRAVSACPPPVLRWLFQLMSAWPDTSNAFQALWEICLSARGEPWCPTLQDIGQAFARMGTDLGALRRRQLLPLELCPTDGRPPDPSCSPELASLDATSTLALVTQLGDICKFLELCVAAWPCHFPDGARQELVTLLCFLGLDRALRCQPLPDLRQLLHRLLEGIRDWQRQLPELCLSLCQLSRHHHNLLALVWLLPDATSRDRELRRRLSLCAMAQLLGKPPGAVLALGTRAELRALGQLLVLSRPDSLQLPGNPDTQEDLDQEACYLSHSLLHLADAVVGSKRPPAKQRGHLERLCHQLEQHFGSGLHEGTGQLFRTQLKGLAALLHAKWRELLEEGPAPPPQ